MTVAYFDMTPEECQNLNLETWKNIRVNGIPVPAQSVGFAEAVGLLGMKLVTADPEFSYDADGKVMTDEKGKPIVNTVSTPLYSVEIDVKVEGQGFCDCEGTPIPTGKQKFLFTLQDNNRPLTESNYKNLVRRIKKWLLNGETMIQGVNNKGLNLQHRCSAIVYGILKGLLEPTTAIPVLLVTGIPLEAGQTIDTGKSNTGKDTFGRDPSLCPIETLKTMAQYNDVPGASGYGDKAIVARKTITGEVESTAKLLTLRFAGKNINASISGGGVHATELAYDLMSGAIPQLGEVVGMVHAFINEMGKDKVASVPELSTALVLSQCGDSEPIKSIPDDAKLDGVDVQDCEPIELDYTSMQNFLNAVYMGNGGSGPLAAWIADKKANRKGDHKVVKFAQLCRAIAAFNALDVTDPHATVSPAINQGNGKTGASGKKAEETSYYSFGGADRGRVAKVKKEVSED